MTNSLADICAAKREHIKHQQLKISLSALEDKARNASEPRGFIPALRRKVEAGGFGLIAEIKKASPSKGIIRTDFNPAELAMAYAQGGAACLSVLTDEPYFQGRDECLVQARHATALPVLRKDFMLEPYQIFESRALGADCILLILAALSDAQARELEAVAAQLGMDVLAEAHNEAELARALAHLKTPLIGINNRDLKTLRVDLSTSERLAKEIPAHILAVCESGIASHADLKRMKRADMHCFLVGESLMRQSDVAAATRSLLGDSL